MMNKLKSFLLYSLFSTNSIRYLSTEQRSALEDFVLTNVLKAPVPSDIISIAGDKVVVGRKIITKEQLNQLRNEVTVLRKMWIWQLLTETTAENARQTMFKNAKSTEDIKFGKTIFYLQDLNEKILDIITRETLDEKMSKVVQLKRNKIGN